LIKADATATTTARTACAGDNKRASFLLRSKLFTHASADTMAQSEAAFTAATYAKRSVIFGQGNSARLVYLVGSGKIRLTRTTDDGKEIGIAILAQGDLFGEEALFGESERSTFATVLEASTLYAARAEDLRGLLVRHPKLTINVARYVSDQRDNVVQIAESLAYLNVRDRLMRLFERLACEFGKPANDATLIDVCLTHADIASLIGSTRETVTAQLGILSREGRIALHGRRILLPEA
jgi:CRP/FNR family cyclic AMP-dependent transcriptional regulator